MDFSRIASVAMPGDALGVTVVGHYAYVANGYAGLQVVDVSNSVSPTIIGSVDTSDEAWQVALLGTYVALADGYAGVCVINVSDPTIPQIVATTDTPGRATGIASSGHIYVADGDSGLQIFSVWCSRSGNE